MTGIDYRLTSWASGYDLEAFDCGDAEYNEWLTNNAERACKSGTSAVYLLLAMNGETVSIAGYFAICPTMIVKEAMPNSLQKGSLSETPGWLLTKLAISRHLRRGDLGEQLLREALFTIARNAKAGGGRVIAVDAGHPKLNAWYAARGFKQTGIDDSRRLYMKVSTARRYLLADD